MEPRLVRRGNGNITVRNNLFIQLQWSRVSLDAETPSPHQKPD